MGTMVEFYAANSSDTCWSSTTNSVDEHYSSGVGNHFLFNLDEGTGATAYGTSPLCGSAPAMTGIGRTKAQKIWYRAQDVYFTSTTRYVNTANPANTARAYTLSAATDLYGLCSRTTRRCGPPGPPDRGLFSPIEGLPGMS